MPESIKDLIWKLVKDRVIVPNITCTVKSVNKEEDTIEATPVIEHADFVDVSLTANIKSKDSKFVIYPKVGTTVIISIKDNLKAEASVSGYSEIDEIRANCESFLHNKGENGGLIKIEKLITELEKLNSFNSAFKTILNGTPIPEPGNGAPSAFQAALKLSNGSIANPNYSQIENEKVKH